VSWGLTQLEKTNIQALFFKKYNSIQALLLKNI
jgi:hypothetical protein